jgi:hypothetical protein
MNPEMENQGPSIRLPHVLLAIGVNLLVLAELTYAVYTASAAPDAFTGVFMKVFFGMLAPTLAAAFFLKRRLRQAVNRL